MNEVSAIIVAAGEGKRFGSAKQFASLGGRAVLEWSLAAFGGHPEIGEIILVLPDEKNGEDYRARHPKIAAVVRGGPRRQDSVGCGFERVRPEKGGIVLVHDGARPLVEADLISRVIAAARRHGAAIPVVPVEDTIKETAGGRIVGTLDRANLCRAQTPQGFAYAVLAEALGRARREGYAATDEAGLVERAGGEVIAVEGDPRNIKVTTPADLKLAEAYLGS